MSTTPPLPRRRLLSTLCLLVTPALLPTAVLAHGDSHADASRDVVREQKPWGITAAPANATRTIEIRMDDRMRFTPSHLDVREGETVRLRIANRSRLLHELVIGTREELQAHAELMKKHPGMAHDEPYMAHVKAGQRSEITWTFNRPGDFEFACLIAGHFQAGMRGTIRVSAAAKATSSLPVVQVWKDPNCGCCKDWIAYLQRDGFQAQVFETGNTAIRQRLGMPQKFASCHTALIAGYVVEGHVNASEIRRMLAEKPQALGLSVPGMPVGSPGMDGPEYGGRKDPYDVLLVQRDGSSRVYRSYVRI